MNYVCKVCGYVNAEEAEGALFSELSEAAVMIWRAAKAKGISLGEGSEGAFADQSKIAEYAKASVGALSGAKIINGFEDGSFRPDNSITRAETAKIVYSVITK